MLNDDKCGEEDGILSLGILPKITYYVIGRFTQASVILPMLIA